LIEVPFSGKNIVLGDDAPGAELTFGAFHCHDAVTQHKRFIGEANPGWERIDFEELWPENSGNLSSGKFETLFSIQPGDFVGLKRSEGWG
jgi:hypothetical protein